MPHLRLCRDTDEDQAPAPIPFRAPGHEGGQDMPTTDAIEHAERALSRAQEALSDLSELVDEDEAASAPFAMTDWLPDDDGPHAA